ncbi:MAG: hypothetical protein U0166_00525 [Acidobacteriota bacterium]
MKFPPRAVGLCVVVPGQGGNMSSTGLLGLAYRLPGVLTLSARLAPKRVVIQQIEPPEVEAIHKEANATFERAASAHLCTFGNKGLPIVGPPLEQRKAELVAAIEQSKPRFEDLIAAVISAWPQIADAITSFNLEYAGFIRSPRSPELDESAVRQRFSPRFTWVPVMLPPEVEAMLFSPEEQDRIRQELAEAASRAYAGKAEGLLREIATCLETASKALRSGRPVDRRTVRRISESYKDLGGYALQTEEGTRLAAEMAAFGFMVESLHAEREHFDRTRRRERSLAGQESAVGSAAEALNAMLDAWSDSEEEVPGTTGVDAFDELVEALAS